MSSGKDADESSGASKDGKTGDKRAEGGDNNQTVAETPNGSEQTKRTALGSIASTSARSLAAFQETNYSCVPTPPDGGPVEINPKFGISSVHAYALNGLEVYDILMRVELSWIDRRFIHWPPRAPVPPQTWRPKLFSWNRGNVVDSAESAVPAVEDAATGRMNIAWRVSLKEEPIDFDSKRMHAFPFDRIHLPVFVIPYHTEAIGSENFVVLKHRLPDVAVQKQFLIGGGMKGPSKLNSPDWKVHDISSLVGTYTGNKTYYAWLVLISCDRHSGYFLQKGFFPLWITVALSVTRRRCCWFDLLLAQHKLSYV